MQIEIQMKMTNRQKLMSQKGIAQKAGPARRSSKIISAVKASLDQREREKIADLVEREEWVKRLGF